MTERRTFVLDTSVLLSDPGALGRFAEHEVVVPLVVIGELEGKRHHPELGWFARQTLRVLDDLRVRHGRLDAPVPIGDGGTLHVELNHSDLSALPAGFRMDSNDSRILAVALNLAAEGRAVTLVTKDMPLRVKAASVGLPADEYRIDAGGRLRLDRHDRPRRRRGGRRRALRRADRWSCWRPRELPCHTGVVLHSARGSALARVAPDKALRLVRGDREAFGLHGRSAEQRVALDLLLDPEVGIVSLGGRAGTGKSALALCAGPRGGARAAGAQAGGRLPAALRRGWPGARLPAGQREREDGALGAGGVRHPRRAGVRRRPRRGPRPRACSRCCR